MYNIIQEIIDECGPRMPCSPQEAKGAEIIKKELEETCDDVAIEPFTCHPRAALGWIKIDILLVLLSISCLFIIKLFLGTFWIIILALITFGLNFLAIIIIWNEFFNYREFIDPLFKEKESQNVIGKIVPSDEVKKIIIFSGHHDSALQFNLLKYLKYGYVIVSLIGIGFLFLWFLISIIFFILTFFIFLLDFIVIYNIFFNLTIWLLIIVAFPVGSLLFFVTPGKKANKVPGAVDNLSAVAIVLGLGRYLKKHRDIIPKNTEIRLASWGSEEAFLRGAYRYVEAHFDELKKFDTFCINMDIIQDLNEIIFLDKEPTTRTIHSKELVKKLLEAAELVNINVKTGGMGGTSLLEKIFGQISGGTDATAFSKAGIKASTILAWKVLDMPKFYHLPTDTPDKIKKGTLENILKICIGYLLSESKKD